VFVVHSGRWQFTFGEHGEDAQIQAGPGDIVSFPTHAFRGFENVGEETGFLWSVLGGDDPGRVLWAPKVFEMAKEYGLVLLENGALVDTTIGQSPPPDVKPMPVTDASAIARLRRMKPEDADEVIARAPEAPQPGEQLVIGAGGQLPAAEGFAVSRLVLGALGASGPSNSSHPEVVFVQSGAAQVCTPDATINLERGDTMTVPAGLERSYCALGDAAELIVVRGTG
jgi:mannose-6-phosphate isomerase-like protein (cupin superfamily)